MSLHAAAVGPSVLPDLREQVEQIIAEARRQGASACEVAVSLEQGLSTSVRQGEVETVEFNRDQGFGITLYAGQRKGSASTSATGEAAIRETVAAALAIARHTSEDECAGLADAALMARELPELDLYHPWSLSPEQAVERALACEAAAFAADKRVTKADGTTLNTHQGCRVYGNSHGFIGGYASTRHSLSCVMIAEGEGQMQRDYWYDVNRRGEALASAESIGRRAAERAASRLGARPVQTAEVPVLFAPEIAVGLFGHFLGAISRRQPVSQVILPRRRAGPAPVSRVAEHRRAAARSARSAAPASIATAWRPMPSHSSRTASWCPMSWAPIPGASSACRARPTPAACITCSSAMATRTRPLSYAGWGVACWSPS